VLAGDFNSLDNDDIVSRCALMSIVDQPSRGNSYLDRIYVSGLSYASVRVVTPAVKSDHKAVIAYSGPQLPTYNKRRERRFFRKRSPAQHALFLEHLSQMTIELTDDADVQANFDDMYAIMKSLLDRFYPERQITVTSTDPHFVTPTVKAMLRRKNRLMRAGRTDEAGALARHVRTVIVRQNSSWLRNVNTRKCAHDAWKKVREVTGGRMRREHHDVDGITAQVLNDHYANISTDQQYQESKLKQTAMDRRSDISDFEVFMMLDSLKATATGLDDIPAWFLRLGAPVFAAPIAQLFNQSIKAGIVPSQWKTAIITPVAKVKQPAQPSDFRPISVTPVLSRMLERFIVKSFIYPAIQLPNSELFFDDQYAFRPTGSTTAALVAILHTVNNMLSSNPYVRVFALDFSKAFDTVRHSTLMEKLSELSIPDQIYNWIHNWLSNRTHSTKFAKEVSKVSAVTASIIQGSGLGPAAYLVTAADLRPIRAGNRIVKYADDTYLIVPEANSSYSNDELNNIQTWASRNNLNLNYNKSKEIVFCASVSRRSSDQLPPLCQNVERVDKLTVLGITINARLTATDHVSGLLSSCSSLLYMLRILRSHGISDMSLRDVFRATVMAKITYCSPAWSGYCTAADLGRLDGFLRRCRRLGYCEQSQPSTAQLFSDIDDTFFSRIMSNSQHILQQFLHDRTTTYSLRSRYHSKVLINKTSHLNNSDFLIRLLYKYSY